MAECAPVQPGMRVVAGESADVASDPVTTNGPTLAAPNQSSNVWGPSLGSPEQIVASVYERRTHNEKLKNLLEEYQQIIEPFGQQYRYVIHGANELTRLIQTNNRIF